MCSSMRASECCDVFTVPEHAANRLHVFLQQPLLHETCERRGYSLAAVALTYAMMRDERHRSACAAATCLSTEEQMWHGVAGGDCSGAVDDGGYVISTPAGSGQWVEMTLTELAFASSLEAMRSPVAGLRVMAEARTSLPWLSVPENTVVTVPVVLMRRMVRSAMSLM